MTKQDIQNMQVKITEKMIYGEKMRCISHAEPSRNIWVIEIQRMDGTHYDRVLRPYSEYVDCLSDKTKPISRTQALSF